MGKAAGGAAEAAEQGTLQGENGGDSGCAEVCNAACGAEYGTEGCAVADRYRCQKCKEQSVQLIGRTKDRRCKAGRKGCRGRTAETDTRRDLVARK